MFLKEQVVKIKNQTRQLSKLFKVKSYKHIYNCNRNDNIKDAAKNKQQKNKICIPK